MTRSQVKPGIQSAATARPPGYERLRDLPRLMPLFADELTTPTLAAHRRLLDLIRRALRAERNRGIAGAWSYDLARHSALLRAWRAEHAAYAERERRQRAAERGPSPTPRQRPA